MIEIILCDILVHNYVLLSRSYVRENYKVYRQYIQSSNSVA